MTTQYQVTSVRTRLWNLSKESTLGQVLGCSLKTIVSPARHALDPKHLITGRTDFFDNSQFRKNHGTQFIDQLPSSSGYTSILVIVDRLMKQAISIATHDP